ncbi:SDR family oxidoreductase [Nocardioides sp. cx-173]|uniref:SDR family oxidoreductase n=1 Tax=Nocardioides sp. cx-173 TaxID=2898796 RepID=UPI001E612748|nr:SDR family oxidoreductase [Nocardioides sp. cx-173]MCD4525984.1 SDR family oxidoreductase [Nocardioides sp. cx-173]UGB43681.1 SDR family oxidoreductase [Nocardioides sp. cx-173]
MTNQDRTALVTGANKGIGLQIAAGLAAEGYRVAVGARDDERREKALAELRADGADVVGVRLDVSSDDSVADAIAELEERFGHLDAVVNNAGISGPADAGGLQDPLTLDLDVLGTVLETNVYGAVRVTNAALPLLRRSSAPRIVNVSSNMGSLALRTGPVMAAYAPSKTLLNAMTVQYARRLAETDPGLLVNAVCPGYVATDFTGFAGWRTPTEGAAVAVRFATLPLGGPSGGFFDDAGEVSW